MGNTDSSLKFKKELHNSRQKLEILINSKKLESDEVLVQSRKLDELIVQYYKKRISLS